MIVLQNIQQFWIAKTFQFEGLVNDIEYMIAAYIAVINQPLIRFDQPSNLNGFTRFV
jgi:hypothetical protein